MKSIAKLALISALLVGATTTHAQWYGEIAYISAKTTYSTTSSTVKSTPEMIGAFIGYELNKNFAAEGLIGTGLSGTDVKVNGASQSNPVTATTDYLYGAFVKPRFELNDDVEMFARLGYIKGKTTSSNSSSSTTDTKGDWSYGIGANYNFSKTTYVTASWMNLYRKDGVKSDGWLIGIGYKF